MWIRFRIFLTLAVDTVRFIKRYRERQQAALEREALERAKEREHQRLLLSGAFEKLIEFTKVQQEGLLKLAESQSAQAAVLAEFFKSYQLPSGTDLSPSTIRDEDEWESEMTRHPEEFVGNLPPEFALALSMQKLDASGADPNPDFDREGRDLI